MEVHLLGQMEFVHGSALQQRLARHVALAGDGGIRLLLCEHREVITIGRGGSPADVRRDSRLIKSGKIPVRWVKRGGGCMVHAPGQLAVYPIVPLRWHGLSVGQYLDRFQAALLAALDHLGIPCQTRPGRHGIWGRTGQLAAFGIAVRDWVTCHGAFVNVAPSMGLLRLVRTGAADGDGRMGSLVAERQGPVTMPSVRAELIPRLAEAFGCDRYHLYTGHPLLREAGSVRK